MLIGFQGPERTARRRRAGGKRKRHNLAAAGVLVAPSSNLKGNSTLGLARRHRLLWSAFAVQLLYYFLLIKAAVRGGGSACRQRS